MPLHRVLAVVVVGLDILKVSFSKAFARLKAKAKFVEITQQVPVL